MNLKLLKLFLVILLFCSAIWAQTSVLPQMEQNINASLLFSLENAKAPVTLTQIPSQFYRNADTTENGKITIAWDTPGIRGNFYYSRFPNVASNLRTLSVFPGDSILDNEDPDNFISFNVGKDSITTGVYYCVIADSAFGKDSTSIEFNMIIEHNLSANNFQPPVTQTGDLSWTRSSTQTQTPFYHLIVSNRPLQLTDDDNDGNREVKGINVIYQAITSEDNQRYRAPDPSGFYNNLKSPRLASGNTYYWLLFNNYGNNPALSSDLISYSAVPNFVYDNPSTVQAAPQNLEPVSTNLTNLDTITFHWSAVTGSDYHLYLYEEIEEDDNIGSFLIYDTTITTGDTSVILNHLKQLLVNTNYYWNVTAENGNLFSASQVDSFAYSTVNSGKLKVETNAAISGNPDLARVNLDIQLLGSSPSFLTYLTDEKGRFSRELVAGNYRVSASKDGFSQLDTIVTILNNDSTDLVLNLIGNPTYFTGKIRIPDLNDIPKIILLSQTVGDTMEIPGNLWSSQGTSSEYTFRANVEPGDWTLFPVADGYKAAEGDTADTTIMFGNYLEIPFTFLLEEIESRIIVRVTDDSSGVIDDFNLTFEKDGNQQIINGASSPHFFEADPGIWIVTIQKDGYFSQSEQYQVEVFSRKDSELDIIMIEAGNIRGITYDDSGQPLGDVDILADPQNALAREAETTSDNNGNYGPLNLKPGDYRILATKTGYSPVDTFITIISNQTISFNPILVENKSFITGVVTDTSGVPLSGAKVNYLYDMGTGFSAPTDSTGRYLFSVPSDISIKVFATKIGYSTSDTTVVTVPINQTDTLNFEIFKLNSIINGIVQTIDQSMLVPLENVIVSAIDTITNQVISLDTTDQAGFYKLYADAGTLFIRVMKQYYIALQDTVTLISGDSLTINFVLDKNYGSLSGLALTNTSSPVANLVVTATRTSTGSVLMDTTDATGAYSFNQLEPGEILDIKTKKIRHIISPFDGFTYFVIGGVDTGGFDFTLTLANITSIEIKNIEKILENYKNEQFDYEAKDGTEPVQIEPPLWTIEYPDTLLFETAQFSTTTSGLFEPKFEAFDAGFSITVEDTAGGNGIKHTVTGFSIRSNLQRSDFSNRNIELKDHTGMVLNVDSTDIITGSITKLVLTRKKVPESKSISSEAESYGDSYNLSLDEGELIAPVILKLPIPPEVSSTLIEEQSQGINVGEWNSNFLDWKILVNSDLQTLPYYAVSNSVDGEGEYIVLITSQPLGIHNLKILPNPFSPNLINYNDPENRNLPGQTIAFDLTSLDIRQPFVSLKIYNMNGELVRELANQDPITKGQVALIWDGKANNGSMARNGRYIVHLKVKDSTGEKEEIKSSVLIK